MTGFRATEEVSLKGSPTVSPTTVASCSGVPFCFISTSTIFLALSHAPPALAMKMAWYKPKMAMREEVADKEERLEECEGQSGEEHRDEDVENAFLRVFG